MKYRISKKTAWSAVVLAAAIEAVIILTLVYLASHKTNPNNMLIEKVLNTNVSTGYDVGSLTHDVNLFNKALSQEGADISIAQNGLKHWTVLAINGSVLKGNQAAERAIQEELFAAIYVNSSNKSVLSATAESSLSNTSKLNSILTRVSLIKSADDQQAAQQIMASLKGKFSKAIQTTTKEGVAITDLSADLTTYEGDLVAAKKLSSNAEATLITQSATEPLISKEQQNIDTAQVDCGAALNAATAIIGILRT